MRLLMRLDDLDVTIAGNGAVACALALRLVEDHPGLRVALVGPAHRAQSASLAAGAMLGAYGELSEGALDTAVGKQKLELAIAATARWDAHLAALNARLERTPPVRVRPGTIIVSQPAAADADPDSALGADPDFAAVLAALAAYPAPFRELDPRDVPGLSPAPEARPRRAILLEHEGSLSSLHLHRAYDEAFARHPSLAVVDAEVTAVSPSGDPSRPTTLVTTSTGQPLRTRQLVLAAGSRTQRILDALDDALDDALGRPLASRIPRLVHGIGVALVLSTELPLPRHVVRTPNRGVKAGLYAVPYDAPYAYVGATTTLVADEDPHPSDDAIASLRLGAARQLHTGLATAAVHKTLLGYRPTTLDAYPLLGQTSVAGLWLATGTKRDGLHLSPELAHQLARALAGGPPPAGGLFAPERALLLPPGQPAAIARATAALLAAAAERAQRGSLSGPGATDPDAVRAAVEDAYRHSGLLGTDLAIPAELLPLYRSGLAAANLEAQPPAFAPPP
jgi:glycine oxidase